jgi:thiamine-monophosphate kinase
MSERHMTPLSEKEIIDLFVRKFKNLRLIQTTDLIRRRYFSATRVGTDDVALITIDRSLKKGVKLVFKCDMLVESTDVPPGMRPWQVARKSIVSCVSDFSAKGIKPIYTSLLSIGFPEKYTKSDVLELLRGFEISSREFGINFVGGDTNKSNELIIDCGMIGFSENESIPSRDGARPGDFIVVSGVFGYSAAGLKILIEGAKAEKRFKQQALSSVFRPRPQQKFGISLARYFSSSIDSSDGLATSLYELAIQSKVNFFITRIPSVEAVECFASNNSFVDRDELIFYGGEEYHIVATIPSRNMKRLMSAVKKLKLKMIVIGKVSNGDGKVFVRRSNSKETSYELLENRGYLHLIGDHERKQ